MIRLDDITEALLAHHPTSDVELVRKAYVFSAAAHRGQTRRNGAPYLVHPLEVSYIVGRLGLDEASVCAALLHDTVEDTAVTEADLRERFGDDVAFLVEGLTKLAKIRFTSVEERQAENFRKMLLAMSRDLRVIVVKLADRLHNMRTLSYLSEEKRLRIARETLEIFAPLANRLGINWLKSELEDLAFKYLYIDEYRDLAERIKKTRRERQAYISRVIAALEGELEQTGVRAEVVGRPKHLWSIRQKMRISGSAFENLYDTLAFRVIVDKVAECYEVLGMVHSVWKPVPGRFKDYVALPKQNGYRSLHTSVIGPESERIEIQIRTREMHEVAELGVAAHWSYKEAQHGLATDQGFGWLRQLLEWQRDLTDPTDFMETVKVDLFDDEVYVFTPQGEVKAFPRGATPVDFAYAIHTDLGHECTGAKVNGSMVPLRYTLQNGDMIEIVRTSGHRPSKDWLKFVKTGRAATKIRAVLHQEARERSILLGREILERELKRYGVSLNKLRRSKKLAKSLAKLNKYRTEQELLLALGYGKTQISTILPALVPEEKLEQGPAQPKEEGPFQKLIKKVLPSRGGIVVDGIEDLATHFPKCCSPVSGDRIVGFITPGRGVTVHRMDCQRVLDNDPERRIDVRWNQRMRQARAVDIRVYSADEPGLLASISQSFHSAGVNITAVNCRTSEDRRAVNNFTILVSDVEQLQRVMSSIGKIKGVTAVERISA